MIVAYNGYDAQKMAEEYRPDVVVLDIGMPGMSGYDAARCTRQSEGGGAMYLMAVTGWGQVEDKRQAIAVGFDGHLTKSVNPDHIVKLLHDLTSNVSVR